jgi:hypothetical protein
VSRIDPKWRGFFVIPLPALLPSRVRPPRGAWPPRCRAGSGWRRWRGPSEAEDREGDERSGMSPGGDRSVLLSVAGINLVAGLSSPGGPSRRAASQM